MTAEADRFYMGLALAEARRGLGWTSPNPAVGCVVARDGRVLGRGFHPRAGEPHAEAFALAEAGDAARGADLYVTLEPCSHHGRTPPCADRVIAAGVRRVVVAAEDPNPRVAGAGLARLRGAGLAVEVGVGRAEAERLTEGFRLAVGERRAFVHLKFATTLDGRIATASGDSRWITSPESRHRVHELRGACGAVGVGVGTAVADDPRLTCRLPGAPERRLWRVVFDPRGRLPRSAWMLTPAEAPHTLVACGPRAEVADLEAAGARALRVPAPRGELDLKAVLAALWERGVMELLVEGGGETARRFLDAGLADRVHWFVSPRILGGRDARGAVGGTSPARIAEAWRLEGVEVERLGPDLYLTGTPAARGGPRE